MTISVSVNADEVIRKVRGFDREVPFATMKALNRTANDVQSAQRESLDENFTLRRKRWAELNVKRNRGDFATKENLVAAVRMEAPGDPSRTDILTKFEDGGVKRPEGTNIAVPDAARRSKTGIIPRAERPSRLFAGSTRSGKRSKVFKKKGRGVHARNANAEVVRGLRGTFMIRYNQGGGSIFRRRAGRLERLYGLTTSARISPRLRFEDNAVREVQAKYVDNFRREFVNAIRTSR